MIKIHLDEIMIREKISVNDLAERIGISPTNLSVLKTGRGKAIRFSTLSALCDVLHCQPGDILRYERAKGDPVYSTPAIRKFTAEVGAIMGIDPNKDFFEQMRQLNEGEITSTRDLDLEGFDIES